MMSSDERWRSDAEIASMLSMRYRVPTIDLDAYEIDLEVIALVSRKQCETYDVLPVSRIANSLVVAMVDPTNQTALDDLKRTTGFNIEAVIAARDKLRASITKYYARPN